MPGLAGIVTTKHKDDCTSLLHAMTSCMRDGASYASKLLLDRNIGVYVGWNRCDNLFAEHRSSVVDGKDVALVFCGECFIDPQTLLRFRRNRHNFCGDARALLIDLYEEYGDKVLEKLNGTFTGVLIDRRKSTAFLFNDRYGLGRIYWSEKGGSIYFASEAKALLQIFPELRAFDDESVAQFLNFGCTLGSRTLFKNIQTLPGGSAWRFEDGRCHKKTYFSPEVWERREPLSAERFESEFEAVLARAVPQYFQADSKIGISLTAGLDSRALMACRPNTTVEPVTYTFDGPKGHTTDSRLAAEVAKIVGLEHHVLRLGHDFFSEFASHVDDTVYATDGCFGVTGAHEIYLNRLAGELAPIRLTGNYGGEVLREVSTFKRQELSSALLNPDIAALANSVRVPLEQKSPVTFAAFREIPWKLFGSLRAAQSQVGIRCPYIDNEIVALAYRAPRELRTSQGPAADLIRRSNPALSKIPTDMGYLSESRLIVKTLRRFVAKMTCKLDYLSSEGFPPFLSRLNPVADSLASILHIAGSHKYLRYRSWCRRELADYVRDAIANARAQQSPFWNSNFLGRMAEDHIHGRKNYLREINAVVTLAAVDRLLFRGLPASRSVTTLEKEVRSQAPVLAT
jgi:asparagine synthase (glutamine-hydrolysing)